MRTRWTGPPAYRDVSRPGPRPRRGLAPALAASTGCAPRAGTRGDLSDPKHPNAAPSSRRCAPYVDANLEPRKKDGALFTWSLSEGAPGYEYEMLTQIDSMG